MKKIVCAAAVLLVLATISAGVIIREKRKPGNEGGVTVTANVTSDSSVEQTKFAVPEIQKISSNLGFDADYTSFSSPLPCGIAGYDLQLTYIGSCNSIFVEKGEDLRTENVLSIIVKNTSEQILEYAKITLTDGTDNFTFVISSLPSKESVLAQATENLPFNDEKEYSFGEVLCTFTADASLNEDKVELSHFLNTLSLTNKTGETIKTAYVYYKRYDESGVYFGGITYRTKFENIAAGETASEQSQHFDEKSCVITEVEII